MPKCTHFTYLLNIDIAIFCKYRIEIEKNDIEAALFRTYCPLLHDAAIQVVLFKQEG